MAKTERIAPDEGAFSHHPDQETRALRRKISGKEFVTLARLLRGRRQATAWTRAFAIGIHGQIFGQLFPGKAGAFRQNELNFGERAGVFANRIESEFTNLVATWPEDLTALRALRDTELIKKAFLYVAQQHAQLIRIHPFIDGNGRWARIVTSVFLFDAGLASGTIVPARRKREYIAATDRAIDHDECGDLADLFLDGYIEQAEKRAQGLHP